MKAVLAVALAVPTAPVVPAAVPASPAALAAPVLPAPGLLSAPSITPSLPAAPTPLALLQGVQNGVAAAAAAGGDGKVPLDGGFDGGAVSPAELVHPAAPSLFDKTAVAGAFASGRMSYGAELASPNPVSAKTLAAGGGISALFVNASGAERGTLARLVDAVSAVPTVVIGRFSSASDPSLKPKLDEGLLGAVLQDAASLKETLRFLRRLYVPPAGRRSVGPSEVTRHLGAVKDFVSRGNGAFLGGVSVSSAKGAANIESILKAKARGLKFVEADASRLSAADLAKVEAAARAAGVPLVGRAATRAEALAMRARGYAHAIMVSDVDAAAAAAGAYADVPADPAREPSLGAYAFLMSPDLPMAQRLAARAGGLWIDREDGQFTVEHVRALIAAVSVPSVVRASGFDDPAIAGYLAAGASGVVAPQVGSASQARAFVDSVRAANPRAKAIVMIENREGLRNLEEIVRVPGVDALFIGPYDLALSLGLEPSSAEFKAAVARIEAAARAAGVPLGGLSRSRSETYAMTARGYGFAAVFSDQGSLAQAARRSLGPSFAAAGY